MLISPETYAEDIKGMSLAELITERNRLIEEIREIEEGMSDNDILIDYHHGIDTIYLNNHLYLVEVCRLIGEKSLEGEFEDI